MNIKISTKTGFVSFRKTTNANKEVSFEVPQTD